jgi:hypothetical protein
MMAAKTRDLFMVIFLIGVEKQFPEIVETTLTVALTETKALELFCTQRTIIAFSLVSPKINART